MDNQIKKEVISILVDNQANVLTRVISLFGRRGFNIDSLTAVSYTHLYETPSGTEKIGLYRIFLLRRNTL